MDKNIVIPFQGQKIGLDVVNDLFVAPAKLGITLKSRHYYLQDYTSYFFYCTTFCQWRQPVTELTKNFAQ